MWSVSLQPRPQSNFKKLLKRIKKTSSSFSLSSYSENMGWGGDWSGSRKAKFCGTNLPTDELNIYSSNVFIKVIKLLKIYRSTTTYSKRIAFRHNWFPRCWSVYSGLLWSKQQNYKTFLYEVRCAFSLVYY